MCKKDSRGGILERCEQEWEMTESGEAQILFK